MMTASVQAGWLAWINMPVAPTLVIAPGAGPKSAILMGALSALRKWLYSLSVPIWNRSLPIRLVSAPKIETGLRLLFAPGTAMVLRFQLALASSMLVCPVALMSTPFCQPMKGGTLLVPGAVGVLGTVDSNVSSFAANVSSVWAAHFRSKSSTLQ